MLGRQLAAFERLALARGLPWGVGAFGIHSYQSEAALRADVAVQQGREAAADARAGGARPARVTGGLSCT